MELYENNQNDQSAQDEHDATMGSFRIDVPDSMDPEEAFDAVNTLIAEINAREEAADFFEVMRRTLEIEARVKELGCTMVAA